VLATEYATWKARHLRDCGDGTACVPRDEGDCISEGVAYGMLLAANNDDRASFDKLWAYFEKHKNANGVMKWQTTACGAATAEGSATDGELDAAMALIQASCQWGDTYAADARELIGAIKNSEVTNCNGRQVLKPGDNFGGCDRTNPSYVAPAYYRVFATFANDTSWTALVNDGYALLSGLQTAQSGLVPDWSDSAGTPEAGEEGQYGPDASRTPWRVATDYVWFNEPQAATFLNNLATYVDANDGVARLFEPNSAFRGGLAMSALPAASTKAQAYTDAWLTTSVDDQTYFPGTLRPLYMLLMAQKFPKGCD
jgi:endo-1,4-beta-D-glucanase Y